MAGNLTRRDLLIGGATAASATLLPTRSYAATTLRWASVIAPTHPEAIMMDKIATELREQTSGAIDIQTFPGGQLGSSHDIIEATSTGALQLVIEGGAQFGQFVPQITIVEAPYLWRDPDHMRRALSSPLIDELNTQLVERRSLRIIGTAYYGRRHMTSGTREVRTIEDMKGFKLRIPEVDTFRAMVEAWHAKPTPLDFGELYLALSQGVVDGQENPLPTIQSAKLNEVQKYLILTGHILTPRLIAVNEPAWQGLTKQQQDLLRESVRKNGLIQDNEIIAKENGLVETFKSGGMTIIQPDVESFRKPVLAVLPAKFEQKWGKGLWDRISAI